VLQKDLIAEHPHVAFTLYDETAIALRRITAWIFATCCNPSNLFSGPGNLGRLPDRYRAGALQSGGASRHGGVLARCDHHGSRRCSSSNTSRYPRVCRTAHFLAIGLIAHERYLSAGVAGSWHSCFIRRQWRPSGGLLRAGAPAGETIGDALSADRAWGARGGGSRTVHCARYQASSGETQAFFTRLDTHLEELQRMRASYNWISLWWQSGWGTTCSCTPRL